MKYQLDFDNELDTTDLRLNSIGNVCEWTKYAGKTPFKSRVEATRDLTLVRAERVVRNLKVRSFPKSNFRDVKNHALQENLSGLLKQRGGGGCLVRHLVGVAPQTLRRGYQCARPGSTQLPECGALLLECRFKAFRQRTGVGQGSALLKQIL